MDSRSRANQRTEWRTETMMKTTTMGTSMLMRRTKKTTTMFRRLFKLLVDLLFTRLVMMKMTTTMRKMRTEKEIATTMTMMTTTTKTKKRRRIWEQSTFADQLAALRMKKRPVILNRKRMARMMTRTLMKMRTMMGKLRHRQRGRGLGKMIQRTRMMMMTVARMTRDHPRDRKSEIHLQVNPCREYWIWLMIETLISKFQVCNVIMGYDHSAVITSSSNG